MPIRAIRAVTWLCDGCDHNAPHDGEIEIEGTEYRMTVKQMKEALREEGWTFRGSRAYCPKHQGKPK
jgi:hypothetical protein